METADFIKMEAFKIFNKFSELYFQFEVLGTQNLPDLAQQNHLFVMNHTAFFGLDGYLLAGVLSSRGINRPIRTMVWKHFLEGPMGKWFKAMGCIEANLDLAAEHMMDGENVVIMPEGTDATDVRNRINTFHTGYLRLLKKVPHISIVPIGFYGIDEAIPWWLTTNRYIVKKMMEPLNIGLDFYIFPKFPVPRPTKIVLAIGEPISFKPEDLDTEEKIRECNARVKQAISNLVDACEHHREQAISRSV
ncbi:1-acyl-sn-glycerol-3-phosphate acyltransferase, partial [Myxococcota bacterium]|nr:1-acyl-sn-glycerol-3-phosphate acyltransferase [Myxococcota bacterium]